VAPGVRHARIDDAGRFRFDAVAPGTYALGVRTAAGARHVHVEMPDDGQTVARVRFPFGGAAPSCPVFDPHGLHAPGWHLAAFPIGPSPAGTQAILAARSDAEGAFAFGSLCAGSWRVEAVPTPDLRDPARQFAHVTVAAGERRAIDVGCSRDDACAWNGRLLLADGSPLAAQELVQIEVRAAASSTAFALGADGTFAGRVRAGPCTVRVLFATGPVVALGDRELPRGAWRQDVTLTAVLRVRSTFVPAAAPQWPRAARRLRLSLAGGATLLAVRAVDGSDCFFGVPAGVHTLRGSPHPIAGAPPAGAAVTMTAAPLVDLDVVLAER
jgi:hypothetical protein